MAGVIIILLLFLWLFGYITIPGLIIPKITLFMVNRHAVTLWEILIFILMLWAVESLPTPFREITGIILLLWILSTLGIVVIAGLSQLLVLGIIVGVIISLFHK